jgi:hypothetical protein
LEKLIELFEPFILFNAHDFAADNVEKLSHALVEDERQEFGYRARTLDWWDYWVNVHIPALRKWTYPLIEGRPLEPRPARSLQSIGSARIEALPTGPETIEREKIGTEKIEAVKTGTDGNW